MSNASTIRKQIGSAVWLLAVFAQLRDSYEVRSKFVHGVPGEVDGELVVRTEGYLRKILLGCLHLGMTPKKEMLDSLVLGQGKP